MVLGWQIIMSLEEAVASSLSACMATRPDLMTMIKRKSTLMACNLEKLRRSSIITTSLSA